MKLFVFAFFLLLFWNLPVEYSAPHMPDTRSEKKAAWQLLLFSSVLDDLNEADRLLCFNEGETLVSSTVFAGICGRNRQLGLSAQSPCLIRLQKKITDLDCALIGDDETVFAFEANIAANRIRLTFSHPALSPSRIVHFLRRTPNAPIFDRMEVVQGEAGERLSLEKDVLKGV